MVLKCAIVTLLQACLLAARSLPYNARGNKHGENVRGHSKPSDALTSSSGFFSAVRVGSSCFFPGALGGMLMKEPAVNVLPVDYDIILSYEIPFQTQSFVIGTR